MRSKLRRLERAARDHLARFELLDGSLYSFDRTSAEMFLFWCECLCADSAHHWPEPLEVYKKLTEAKYSERALDEIHGRGPFSTFVYDPAVLIIERRLEPSGLVTRYDPETGEHISETLGSTTRPRTSRSNGMETCWQAHEDARSGGGASADLGGIDRQGNLARLPLPLCHPPLWTYPHRPKAESRAAEPRRPWWRRMFRGCARERAKAMEVRRLSCHEGR